MKRLFRYVCVLLAAFTLLSLVTVAGAAGTQVIDASHTSAGYVTVSYTSAARLKVGIQYGSGKTAYRDCPSGTTSFALDQGNGTYTVENVTGPLVITATEKVGKVKINLTNNTNAKISGITDGQEVDPGTALSFTAELEPGKELVVTVGDKEVTGSSRPGAMFYTIAADQVTGTELNIVVNYKSSTDTITIIGSGDAWSDVDLNSSVGWEKSGKVTDKATAALKIKPATGKTIEDYVVTINGKTQDLTQEGKGPRTRYMVAFVPADVAKDNIIKIDVSYKKTEPTITVNVSEYLKLNKQSIFLITATCDELTESKVLAYGEKQMYWSEKYNNNGAYAWLVIADGTKSLDALTAEAKTVIAAVDGTKAEIVYNGDDEGVHQRRPAGLEHVQCAAQQLRYRQYP